MQHGLQAAGLQAGHALRAVCHHRQLEARLLILHVTAQVVKDRAGQAPVQSPCRSAAGYWTGRVIPTLGLLLVQAQLAQRAGPGGDRSGCYSRLRARVCTLSWKTPAISRSTYGTAGSAAWAAASSLHAMYSSTGRGREWSPVAPARTPAQGPSSRHTMLVSMAHRPAAAWQTAYGMLAEALQGT